MRRLEVPLSIKRDRLHTTIQIAMGWTDSHLYEFRFAGGAAFGVPDPDYISNTSDARKATLGAALEDCGARSLHYVYDFGDYWDHIVSVERIETGESGFPYPSLLTATGQCPPPKMWAVQQAISNISKHSPIPNTLSMKTCSNGDRLILTPTKSMTPTLQSGSPVRRRSLINRLEHRKLSSPCSE
jgi:hypothetical protein